MQCDSHDDPTAEPSGKESPDVVGIEPYRKIGNNKSLMDILLSDRTTNSNLIWATADYESQGPGFGFRDKIQYLYIINPNRVIRPRYLKSFSEQRSRSQEMAEVFTPPWIVNKQNNLVDEQWFGKKDVFNTETGDSWIPAEAIDFGDRDWKDYVRSIRMEVCCGEAPYLTTRYDSIDGTEIPVRSRVGLLDRKLRVISENVSPPLSWIQWAEAAVKSIYAYDFQGDNVLLSRENVLLSVAESYRLKFGEELSEKAVEEIAQILSWNIWQMDGIRMVVPFSCDRTFDMDGNLTIANSCPACRTGKGRHSGTYCRIMDWEKETTVEFASMAVAGGSKPSVTGCRTLESFEVQS